MRLRVVWFGRVTASPYEDQVATYRERVSRRWPADDHPLRPAAGGRDNDPRRALAAEAEAARRAIPQRWLAVALDEGGRQLDSVAFAEQMQRWEAAAAPGLVFFIGSDLGLERGLRSGCSATIALSRMTLPHLLARLVLWEQLFRAAQILDGGGYHRQSVQ